MGEPERTGSQSADGDLRKRASGATETSTPLKCRFPICSKRKSSMLWETSGSCQAPASSRYNFKIGEEGSPDTKSVVLGEGLCNRLETGNGRNSADIELCEIEKIARAVDNENGPLAIGAAVQQFGEAGFAGCISGVAGGMGAERRRVNPSHSAKTL